jgi:peptidyl-prolyl cis-trans isomerase B (cyclophilin B)
LTRTAALAESLRVTNVATWIGKGARLSVAALLLLAASVGLATPARAGNEEVAVLRTPLGEIAWRFLPKDAPEHVRYVKHLIETGFYDGTTFHRVIPHFVIQGGDPNSKNDDRSDDGEGEADHRLKAEFSTRLHYRPGTVGMARDADPDSGSCQFFIALENLPRLDGRYTIFGEVVEGLEVARRIAGLPRDLNDNPLARVPMTVRLEKRALPDVLASVDPGLTGSGETLTGPDKPRPFDPGNRLWTAPALIKAALTPGPGEGKERVEVAIDPAGRVIDVRFTSLEVARPEMLQAIAYAWTFTPAQYDGSPRKTRVEINADGSDLGPPSGGGAPLDPAGAGIVPPRAAVRVALAENAKPPVRPARLRLTIDASGAVTDAALQESCGDAGLDAEAVRRARDLLFEPATRRAPGRSKPDPIAVYLDVEARFVPAAGP